MVTKVSTLLENKKIQEILHVKPNTTVIAALEMMAKFNIGALLVMENNELKGIFSERDYARKGIIKGRKAKSTSMEEVMTTNVISVQHDKSIKECMEIMSEGKFRHLPVLDDDKKVVGVLSVGDIVTALILEQRQHIKYLENYISG